MDLNHINLPPSLVTEFYKNHLLESNSQQLVLAAPASSGMQKNIQYLGKNKKGVCLLVNYANDVYLPDEQLNFLTTILQACKLDLGDVAIINCNREKISFAELRKQITCNYLLIFGDVILETGINEISLFNIQNISDCYIVYSPAAEYLNNKDSESKLLKSKLWLCLKQMFGV